jgi:hypothetical protein
METYQTMKTGAAVVYMTYVADKGWVLNDQGGSIFNVAVPKLQNVRPNIFQVTSNSPIITTTAVSTPGKDKMNYRIVLGSQIAGFIDNLAAGMGIDDPKIAGGTVMVAIYAIFAFGTIIKGFAWAGLIAAFPIVLLGMYYGLLDPQLILIMLVIIAFCFTKEFIWKWG